MAAVCFLDLVFLFLTASALTASEAFSNLSKNTFQKKYFWKISTYVSTPQSALYDKLKSLENFVRPTLAEVLRESRQNPQRQGLRSSFHRFCLFLYLFSMAANLSLPACLHQLAGIKT